MRPIDQSPHLCSVDPITLTGLALGALGGLGGGLATGALGGGGAPAPAAPTAPPAPQAAAPPQQAPQAKGIPRAQQPTFIGAAATPPTQSGQKSLLGQ